MVEQFSLEKHYPLVNDWFTARALTAPPKELFSDFGFVVDEVAIGFLFDSNSKKCSIDNIVVNPTASEQERDAAFSTLFQLLEDEAKSRGYLAVTFLAGLPKMQSRLTARSYEPIGQYTLVYKSL